MDVDGGLARLAAVATELDPEPVHQDRLELVGAGDPVVLASVHRVRLHVVSQRGDDGRNRVHHALDDDSTSRVLDRHPGRIVLHTTRDVEHPHVMRKVPHVERECVDEVGCVEVEVEQVVLARRPVVRARSPEVILGLARLGVEVILVVLERLDQRLDGHTRDVDGSLCRGVGRGGILCLGDEVRHRWVPPFVGRCRERLG